MAGRWRRPRSRSTTTSSPHLSDPGHRQFTGGSGLTPSGEGPSVGKVHSRTRMAEHPSVDQIPVSNRSTAEKVHIAMYQRPSVPRQSTCTTTDAGDGKLFG